MKTILYIICLFLLSCSSVKKLKTSTHKTVDSSIVTNAHIQLNTKQDSTNLKMTGENHETKLEITFDSIRDYPQPYETGKLPFVPQLHTIKIAGKEISSTQRMKLLTVMVSGETSVFDLTKNVKSDSSASDSNKSVTVNKIDDSKSRSVQRKGMKVLIALGIFLIIAVGIYIYVKRRKMKNSNTLILLVAILFALSSCSTTHIYNVRYVHDTVFVEKPVVKIGLENKPKFPILTDDYVVPCNLDSLLKNLRIGNLIIDSSKTYYGDSIILMKPFIKSNFFNSNPNYMPASEWHDAITSDGSDCDTCSNFIIISGNSSVKTIKGNIIIGGGDCDTGKAFINIGPCTNCIYLGTDSTIKNTNL